MFWVFIYICAKLFRMELRDRIINEATRQFFNFGIRSVTMDGIASELGISKRTVYETFKDKTELVKTCLSELAVKHEQKNNEVVANAENVIEAIFIFMQQGIKAMNSINPVFFVDMKKLYPEIWKSTHRQNTEKGYNMTHKLLRKGVNEGLFRKDINLNIVSKLFHEQMNLISDEQVFPRDEFDHPEVFRNLVVYFLRGISSQKGIDYIDKKLSEQQNQ